MGCKSDAFKTSTKKASFLDNCQCENFSILPANRKQPKKFVRATKVYF